MFNLFKVDARREAIRKLRVLESSRLDAYIDREYAIAVCAVYDAQISILRDMIDGAPPFTHDSDEGLQP